MDFWKAKQLSPEGLQSINFDLILTAYSRDERCNYLLVNYTISGKQKVDLGLSPNFKQLKSANKLLSLGGSQINHLKKEKNHNPSIEDLILDTISNREKDIVNILIDYSCMQKSWYASIINSVTNYEEDNLVVNLYFSYTPAEYTNPKKSKSIRICESLLAGNGRLNPEKTTALIVGLGIEPGKSELLLKNTNADSIVLFYSDPAPAGYIETIFENNREIIEKTDIRNMRNYSLYNIQELNSNLTNLCLNLRLKNNVIIAPIGPKVFTLASLLVAMNYPDIDVWHVSTGNNVIDNRKKPSGEPIIYRSSFTNSEED